MAPASSNKLPSFVADIGGCSALLKADVGETAVEMFGRLDWIGFNGAIRDDEATDPALSGEDGRPAELVEIRFGLRGDCDRG